MYGEALAPPFDRVCAGVGGFVDVTVPLLADVDTNPPVYLLPA
jgi:hypothetical protein